MEAIVIFILNNQLLFAVINALMVLTLLSRYLTYKRRSQRNAEKAASKVRSLVVLTGTIEDSLSDIHHNIWGIPSINLEQGVMVLKVVGQAFGTPSSFWVVPDQKAKEFAESALAKAKKTDHLFPIPPSKKVVELDLDIDIFTKYLNESGNDDVNSEVTIKNSRITGGEQNIIELV